jgi:hypothetical protein
MDGQKTIADSTDNGSAVYSPGGNFIAELYSSPDRTVSLIIRTWQSWKAVAYVQDGGADRLHDYRWSPDGHWFATIGGDYTLQIRPVSIN